MYENLIETLRFCAKNGNCHDCPTEKPCAGTMGDGWECEAADAIEELNRIIYLLKSDRDAERDLRLYAEQKIPRWIPVTEEPPLKVGDDGHNGYLIYGIYDGNGYYEVADYTTDKFDNVPYFYVDGEYEPDVTHYMPLPEPPKEEA